MVSHEKRSSKASQKVEDHQDLTGGTPSRHLWVGNVAQEIPEAILREQFDKFGELESVTVYPQRNYAFVNFRKQEHAEKAKENLHGFQIAGMAMRIEFAKGARPNRHLLVSGISPNISKEMLEAEFSKYGAVEEVKMLRDKNSAFVDYSRTEDAISALAALNNRGFGDDQLKVDYRTLSGGKRAAPSAPAMPPSRSGGHHHHKNEPSEVLWIGLPSNSKIDEDTLQRLFAPYGEVERVKVFSSRNYCFVEFRTSREAAAAKSALHNKTINGHRLNIEFSTSEVGPVDEAGDGMAKKPRLSSPPEQQQVRTRSSSPLLPPPPPEAGDAWKWHGIIAKGGTVVCQVWGFNAIGKVETLMPEVLNCTARTDLELLAKHMYTAPFSVVAFLPVRDVDAPPYHDFVQYLRDKSRAGVAKLRDGATVFLVPPSPFSEKVLKLQRNDCLFGVFWPHHQQQHFLLPHQQQQILLPQQQQQLLLAQQAAGLVPKADMPPPGYAPASGVVRPPWQPPQPAGIPPLSAAAALPAAHQEYAFSNAGHVGSATPRPPFVEANAQQFQQEQPRMPPQLPMDQLAQLTAIFAQGQPQQQGQQQGGQQGQQQQQSQAREVSPLPQLPQATGAWPTQVAGADPASNETFRRTLELAAKLLASGRQP